MNSMGMLACMQAQKHPHTYIHTSIHACMHACMHAYIHTYIRIVVYIQRYIHTEIRAYIPTCIHAYMPTCLPVIHAFAWLLLRYVLHMAYDSAHAGALISRPPVWMACIPSVFSGTLPFS